MTVGHIILAVDGLSLLLDTGAPSSVGPGTIAISGKNYTVKRDYMGVTPAYLSTQIGVKIDGLIGADIIKEFTLTVDPERQEVFFESQASQLPIAIPVESFMGIPIITISIKESVIQAFFDTGAHLSYIDPKLTEGMQPSGRREDFYPGIGKFSTDVFQLDTDIGGERLRLTYGHLPHLLAMTLMAAGTQGIAGTELFDTHIAALSINRGEMRLKRI